eukprot:CAMPEP_0118939452 /NCGR_PEP_ID=MMETSP1169-20130426/28927_1 /TAXON_ID=36882 /ORGANISM="Pyramimonas obovata, Strain CCMP722" /LENGTH=319 /DNA_ID=CAMNT_0006883725 /DNA_START=215 /DNA_END=1174 /DNA_ORIENTATION=-
MDRTSAGASCCRDRTSEFFAVAERLRKQQGKNVPLAPNGLGLDSGLARMGSAANENKSEFSKRAARIGHGIHGTSTKLAKLAQLAKRTSMFDDPAQEIAELTTVVKQDISALNNAISDLQQFAYRSDSGYNSNKHNQEHSSTVVNNLKARLMNATKEFKEVLTVRTENLKVHDDRRGLFSSKPSKGLGASEPLFGKKKGSLQGGAAPGAAPSFGGGGQQMMATMPQANVHASRAEALQNVESTIAELGGIFQQLATMVAEQGELAVRIDENIDETLSNVEMAQTHLLKYLNRISSNRWLILKIFFVLMIFLVIFVVFVA